MSAKRRQFTSQFKAKVAMEAMKGQQTPGEFRAANRPFSR